MQTLFRGIDVGEVSVSMTINAPAAIMLAFYVVVAEREGVPAERLAGTIQADILRNPPTARPSIAAGESEIHDVGWYPTKEEPSDPAQ
jgi:methylmalonyl-CoA mutase N-terminal domain/subunit